VQRVQGTRAPGYAWGPRKMKKEEKRNEKNKNEMKKIKTK
jgi:hypothetical protein